MIEFTEREVHGLGSDGSMDQNGRVTAEISPVAKAGRPRLFGRSDQVARLVELADRAVEHGAQMVVVSGEAGIGKTSLATETLAQLEENGWRTHVGYCIEYADRSVPFGPIVSILRSVLLDNLDNMDEIVGRRRDDLAGLLPELASDKAGHRSLAGDVDRLFDAIAGCLTEVSRRRPSALLIEDIHWADAATRDLATSLVRNLGAARVLLIITERSGAIARSHPLRTWLAEHRRMPNVHYLALEGLLREELAEQAESVLNRVPESALIEQLIERTGGNPYFSQELLVALSEGDQTLPSSLSEFLTSRLERLNDAESEVLRSLAVAGGLVSHRLLSDMLPDRPVGDLVRSLFDASILVVKGSNYAFRHALLREAILRDILPFELEALHRRVAESIVSDPRRGKTLRDLASLALHWAEADDPDRSLEAAVAAAEAAAAVAAYESAAEMALQALWAWPDASSPEDVTGLTRDQLLLQAADWLTSCYRGEEAVGRINDALADWAKDLPSGRRALLLAKMAPIHWHLGNPHEAEQALAEAKRLIPAEVSAEAAQVHNRLSKQAVADGQIGPARDAAEQAIAIATVEGPRVVLVEALTTKALAMGVTGDLEGSLELACEARELALQAGFVSQVANTYRTEMLVILFQQGRTDACLDASRKGLAYAEQHCGPRWRADFRLDLCLGYVEGGRLTNAEPLFEALMSKEHDDLRRLTVLQTAGLYALAKDSLDLAGIFLRDATEIAGRYQSAQETGFQAKLLAELARREGRLDDAAELIDEALGFQLAGDNLTYTRESIVEKIRIGRECSAHGRADAKTLLAEARALVNGFDGSGTANVAMRALMELELASIDGTIEPKVAAATATALEDTGYLLEAAEAQLLLLTHVSADRTIDRKQLEVDLARLHRVATTHGMSWILTRLTALARTVQVILVDSDGSKPAVAESAPSYPNYLTHREVEVMSLLAEGLTNKGIGERLFVSPRTVSTHISNLLAKLGVGNRGEAAAAYHRLGLAAVIDLRDPSTAQRPTS